MKAKKDRRLALVKPHLKITRRILVGASENERRPLLEDVKRKIREGIDEVLLTAQSLRKDHGVLLPILSPEWDWVPTREATPSHTISAFEGNRSEVRVTLHLDELIDNTTTIELDGHGISHLIGISIGGNQTPKWERSDNGGMLAVVNSSVPILPSLLHDVLLDMAMIHAKAQPWTGIRDHLNAQVVASVKAQFVQENNLIGRAAYGSVEGNRYCPFAAFARTVTPCSRLETSELDLTSYVALWSSFASFAKETTNSPISCERKHLAERIARSHVNGGQLSIARLTNKISQLAAGYYCLYFLTRKADTQAKIAELSAFFHTSKAHFRTQRWIIYPRDKVARHAALLLHERYISVFPFYVGEE